MSEQSKTEIRACWIDCVCPACEGQGSHAANDGRSARLVDCRPCRGSGIVRERMTLADLGRMTAAAVAREDGQAAAALEDSARGQAEPEAPAPGAPEEKPETATPPRVGRPRSKGSK